MFGQSFIHQPLKYGSKMYLSRRMFYDKGEFATSVDITYLVRAHFTFRRSMVGGGRYHRDITFMFIFCYVSLIR